MSEKKTKDFIIDIIVSEQVKNKIDFIMKKGLYINLQEFIFSALVDKIRLELPKFFDEYKELIDNSKTLDELRIIYSEIEETKKDKFVHIEDVKKVLLK